MTKNLALLLALLGMLAACGDGDGTNPVNNPGSDEETDDSETEDDETETASDSIIRYEEQDESSGNGYVTSVSYDAENDTFTVDNIGFDADNVYDRDDQVASLGPFALYEASDTFYDSVTGEKISQLTDYKALYGVSTSGKTEFAIVRTGAYVDYGFGGYMYARNGSVTLPTSGQASYTGDYAGLRDFKSRADLEYVTGDMDIAIDFEDFNDGSAVQGSIYNRRVYDTSGNDVTDDILTAIGIGSSSLPNVTFSIGPGVLSDNGELTGELASYYYNSSGALETFESGNYYAIVSGNSADEIVGVIVIESDDPRYDGVTARETGGFILYR